MSDIFHLMTETDNSEIAVISAHSSAMTLKTDAFRSFFKIDSQTHLPNPSIKAATPREVYTAFREAFLTKTCNSLAPQDKIKSTDWEKLVE